MKRIQFHLFGPIGDMRWCHLRLTFRIWNFAASLHFTPLAWACFLTSDYWRAGIALGPLCLTYEQQEPAPDSSFLHTLAAEPAKMAINVNDLEQSGKPVEQYVREHFAGMNAPEDFIAECVEQLERVLAIVRKRRAEKDASKNGVHPDHEDSEV